MGQADGKEIFHGRRQLLSLITRTRPGLVHALDLFGGVRCPGRTIDGTALPLAPAYQFLHVDGDLHDLNSLLPQLLQHSGRVALPLFKGHVPALRIGGDRLQPGVLRGIVPTDAGNQRSSRGTPLLPFSHVWSSHLRHFAGGVSRSKFASVVPPGGTLKVNLPWTYSSGMIRLRNFMSEPLEGMLPSSPS